MLFLVRCVERGKEPHATKSKLRHDIAERIAIFVPDAHLAFDTGRIYIETDRDITDDLRQVHGITSFSPCTEHTQDTLDEHAVALAEALVAPGRSFRVTVRRSGTRSFSSKEKAAELGARILERIPGARVDLRAPDVEIAIEIRGSRCFLCKSILPGIDARRPTPSARPSLLDAPSAPRASAERPQNSACTEPRFLVDAMLGTLATRLRAFGFDTEWRRDTADSLLLREAADEGRILLTQDRELAQIGAESAHFVHAKTADEQVREVMDRYGLEPSQDRLFTRCSVCNSVLLPASKESVRDRVPPKAFAHYDSFWTCRRCDKVYWKGSHYEDLRRRSLPVKSKAKDP